MRLKKTYSLATTGDDRYPTIAVQADDEGTFTSVVSVMMNVDYQGDRVLPGAFSKSIARWQQSGKVLPVIWNHSWSDPFAHVGWANPSDVREVGPGEIPGFPRGGLYVKGRFDLSSAFATQVYKLVKERRVTEWSFSYDTIRERRAEDGANNLVELELIEIGPTLKGANEETATVDVKSATAPVAARDDRDVVARLDHLELAALEVGAKRRSQVPIDDEVSLREHLRQRHANQITPEAANRMSLSELRVAHAVCHPDMSFDVTALTNPGVSSVEKAAVSREVDRLIADVRGEKQKQEADAETFRLTQEALLSGPIDWAAQDEREAERRKRDDAELERRAAERAATADAAEAADAIRRTRGWRQTGPTDFYIEGDALVPLPRKQAASFRLDVAGERPEESRAPVGAQTEELPLTIEGLGETFAAPVWAQPMNEPVSTSVPRPEGVRLSAQLDEDRVPVVAKPLDEPPLALTPDELGKTIRIPTKQQPDERRRVTKEKE
jgi:HK97 family phage prohead protease